MENEKKGLSIVSLILGILGILMCSFGFLPSVIGLILAIVAKAKKKAGPSTAALIVSIAGTVLSFIAGIAAIIVISSIGVSGLAAAIGLAGAAEAIAENGPYTYEYNDPYTYEDPYTYDDPTEYNDPYEYGDPYGDDYGVDPIVEEDEDGAPDYQNAYVRLYQQNDGTVKIKLDDTLSPYTQFEYVGRSLSDILDSINTLRAMDNLRPLPEELFYEVLTCTIPSDEYFAATDDEMGFQIQYYTAIAAQAVSYTIDVCPDAHVAYAIQEPGEIYTVYFDNGYSMTYNTIQDTSLEGYPYYVDMDINGAQVTNRCSVESFAVYVYATEYTGE